MTPAALIPGVAAIPMQEVLQKLADRLIRKQGYAPQIPITYEDLAKLTPGQIDQAHRIAAYSRDTAVRYVASITRPKELSALPCKVQRKRKEKDSYNSSRFLDSVKVRDIALSRVSRPLILLNRIKRPVPLHIWDSKEYFTTKDVASYYGISERTVRRILLENRAELEQEGITQLTGSRITQEDQASEAIASSVRITAWHPRAVVRVGLLIHQSEVGTSLRKVLAAGCRV